MNNVLIEVGVLDNMRYIIMESISIAVRKVTILKPKNVSHISLLICVMYGQTLSLDYGASK